MLIKHVCDTRYGLKYVTRRVTFGPNAQMTLLSKMTSK